MNEEELGKLAADRNYLIRKIDSALERAREAIEGDYLVGPDYANALFNLIDDLDGARVVLNGDSG